MLLGVVATSSHICLSRSLSMSDIMAVLPYDFTHLPFVALVAFLAFGQIPDIWTWAGAGVIFSSAIYIARREARLNPDDALPTAAAAAARADDSSPKIGGNRGP